MGSRLGRSAKWFGWMRRENQTVYVCSGVRIQKIVAPLMCFVAFKLLRIQEDGMEV